VILVLHVIVVIVHLVVSRVVTVVDTAVVGVIRLVLQVTIAQSSVVALAVDLLLQLNLNNFII